MRGKFICLYGMNNLGKTTQAQEFVLFLQKMGHKATYLKYPIYDLEPTGPMINDYLRNGKHKDKPAIEVQTWYAQNRRDFEPTLRKLLDEGCCVVSEDYTGTGEAWGRINGADPGLLRALNEGLIRPDLEVLIDGERFNTSIEKNHAHEGRSQDEWERGRMIHLVLGMELGWERVFANGSIKEVHDRLIRVVEQRLPLLVREGTYLGKERFF